MRAQVIEKDERHDALPNGAVGDQIDPPGATCRNDESFATARRAEIKVKLMSPADTRRCVLPRHPLAQLLQAVAAPRWLARIAAGVFQIPVEGGRASLFASHQLSASCGSGGAAAKPSAARRRRGSSGTPSRRSATSTPTTLACDAVMPPRQGQVVVDERHSVKDYRQSLVLQAPADVERLVVAKIRAVMPEVMPQVKMPPFTVGRIECQVTASTDGSYFRPHTDAGKGALDATRKLTYVYYFNREPKGFTGGELRVYDDELANGKFSSTDTFQLVEPRNNSIVFFNAAIMHEVVPVHVPSKDFADSRFTVNGWVHRT